MVVSCSAKLSGAQPRCLVRRQGKGAVGATVRPLTATPLARRVASARRRAGTPLSVSEAPGDVEDSGSTKEGQRFPPLSNAPSKVAFRLNVLWQEQFCAVAVDHVLLAEDGTPGPRTPLTEYYFWPKVDAWEELKKTLDSKDWISETESIILMNTFTDVINYWQELHSKEEAQAQFKDVFFSA
mmetsp:Transcript_32081/g.57445  ORF Transcript_32081/g.57445 Transcript_32081/m.57445 type:complete len:183 (-) Transcript_32081:23-571(-)